jgi:hypothetical protein
MLRKSWWPENPYSYPSHNEAWSDESAFEEGVEAMDAAWREKIRQKVTKKFSLEGWLNRSELPWSREEQMTYIKPSWSEGYIVIPVRLGKWYNKLPRCWRVTTQGYRTYFSDGILSATKPGSTQLFFWYRSPIIKHLLSFLNRCNLKKLRKKFRIN